MHVVTLTYALKINHTVSVTMLSRIQRSTHFFKQLQALPQTNGRLFITKIGPCTYTGTHCLCFAGKMSTNLRKKKAKGLSNYCEIGWEPLETTGATMTFNIYRREKTNLTKYYFFVEKEIDSCCWVLQMHEKERADVTLDQHNWEEGQYEQLIWHHKEENQKKSSSAPLQLMTPSN